MDYETLKWIRVVHIFAFLGWTGGLIGLSFILRQHAKAAPGARTDFVELERGTAMAMDIFAMITLVAGLVMLLNIEGIMRGHGWMHAKLTLIVILVGLHGFQRMRTGKYRKEKITPNPAWIIPAIELTVLGIIVMAVARPF